MASKTQSKQAKQTAPVEDTGAVLLSADDIATARQRTDGVLIITTKDGRRLRFKAVT